MNTSNTLPLPGPIAAAHRGRRPQVPAQQPTEAEIICAIVTHIRTGLFTADDIADCIEGTYGADVADHAYELIYDHAGDAVDCLWEFNPMGWLMMPSFQHQQIPIMF